MATENLYSVSLAKGYNDYSSGNNVSSRNSLLLENRLEEIKDKQGFFGSIWNGIKEGTGLGLSESDCESYLEAYKRGQISFEEAAQYLEDFDKKQSQMSDLGVNVLTGIGGIATATLATAAGPIGWGLALAEGAPIGAAIKVGLKTLDRATNDIEGDELDIKQMAKDAISGALTGTTSAVSSGVGAGIKAANFGLTVANGAKCSALCGGVSGATSYLTDVAFGDEEFDTGELIGNTATSALISGSVGAFVGGGMYGTASLAGNTGKEVAKTTSQTIVKDSFTSSLRKVLNQGERNLIQS